MKTNMKKETKRCPLCGKKLVSQKCSEIEYGVVREGVYYSCPKCSYIGEIKYGGDTTIHTQNF